VSAVRAALTELDAAGCQFHVLLAQASLDETRELAQRFPQFDLIVTAGGAGEPTLDPETVPGSQAKIIQTGTKGMYVGLVGVFNDPADPVRYRRVALDSRFPDSRRIMERFAAYQQQLKVLGLEGLGLRGVKHPSGRQFVGTQACAECHTEAYDVFEDTPHAHAFRSIAEPTERSEIPRHHDPECLSCHVVGWNPQDYYPYDSGYLDVQKSAHLLDNGCENCHGPGSSHVAAENGDIDVSDEDLERLRVEMRLTLEKARNENCFQCHDLDNSPEFDFERYWPEVEHYGKD
jgi:hypothetical protein